MKCITEKGQLTIRLEGMERVWALKRRLQVPYYAIAELSFEPDLPAVQDFSGHLRMLGTALPANFMAGSYHRGDEREFWYVRLKQPGILTIELKPDTCNYDRIRVTCSPEVADTITTWWRAVARTPV